MNTGLVLIYLYSKLQNNNANNFLYTRCRKYQICCCRHLHVVIIHLRSVVNSICVNLCSHPCCRWIIRDGNEPWITVAICVIVIVLAISDNLRMYFVIHGGDRRKKCRKPGISMWYIWNFCIFFVNANCTTRIVVFFDKWYTSFLLRLSKPAV